MDPRLAATLEGMGETRRDLSERPSVPFTRCAHAQTHTHRKCVDICSVLSQRERTETGGKGSEVKQNTALYLSIRLILLTVSHSLLALQVYGILWRGGWRTQTEQPGQG